MSPQQNNSWERGMPLHIQDPTNPNSEYLVDTCRIPDDCIDPKRYPLFMARAVLQELIESLQSTRGVKSC